MTDSFSMQISNPEAMTAFGGRLAELLFPGAVIGLNGQLGAGKTFLVRAIAEGLDIADSRVVNSPTFVLIQEYDARLCIYHFDAYRLTSPDQFADLGVHEYFEGDGVSLIEWADRVCDFLPSDHLAIHISITGQNYRDLVVAGKGARYELLLRQLKRVLDIA